MISKAIQEMTANVSDKGIESKKSAFEVTDKSEFGGKSGQKSLPSRKKSLQVPVSEVIRSNNCYGSIVYNLLKLTNNFVY